MVVVDVCAVLWEERVLHINSKFFLCCWKMDCGLYDELENGRAG